MCGIAGIVDPRAASEGSLKDIAVRMRDALSHRGPDDKGYWEDASAGVGLGHRRLSILDLSQEGHQPMLSESGRYVIVYNGEVYNFTEIRAELEGAGKGSWRGTSDTEVVLAAFERWGVEKSLARFNGMFAFVLWDKQERVLVLARDRMGKKPLYYGWLNGSFVFASEIKAFRKANIGSLEVNRNSLPLLLRFNYIPSPHSIYSNIYKLPAATYLSLDMNDLTGRSAFNPDPAYASSGTTCPQSYWSLEEKMLEGLRDSFRGTEEDAMNELDWLLKDATRLRMISDVPLGAFLSGGIDSSIVVAEMVARSTAKVKTFCIGYDEEGNEGEYAKAVAKHLGTDHTELYVSGGDALDLIPRIPELSDEPHGDMAILPTYIVSKLARESVTVALSGDGGDELFAGYPRYIWANERWLGAHKRLSPLPLSVRRAVGSMLRSFDCKGQGLFAKIGDLGHMLSLGEPEEVYQEWVYHWRRPQDAVLGADEPLTTITDTNRWCRGLDDPIQRMVYLDLASRLPDSIVSKVDRTTMQVSLESRCPLLDYRVAEFSMRVPRKYKIYDGMGKRILRKLLCRYVPNNLIDRPKRGFKMPVGVWLRGPLRDWAEALLDEDRLKTEGFLDAKVIRQKWDDHMTGRAEWHYQLWDVLMLQAWLENSRK